MAIPDWAVADSNTSDNGTRADSPTDIHASAHNDHDVQFLHDVAGHIVGSLGAAKAVQAKGIHPEVAALAANVLATRGHDMTSITNLGRRIGTSIGTSITAGATTGTSGHGQGGGNAYGQGGSQSNSDTGNSEARSATLTARKAMSTGPINDLPDSAFAFIEPGGTKDASGKTTPRSKRHFLIHDKAHTQNALARLSQSPFGPKAKAKVMAAAKKFGIKVGSDSKSRNPNAFQVRSFNFESEVAGDGRTLEGYAAVFDSVSRISDWNGDFDEVIRPGAFSRSLTERTPVLQYDHGRDPRVGSVPIGSIEDIHEDNRGLYVRARLFDNPVVEPVRQAIEGKSISGMSFRFAVPQGGDKWTNARERSDGVGDADFREILHTDTRECGPVVFPAYDDTTVGVRALMAQLDPEERNALCREFVRDLADELQNRGIPILGLDNFEEEAEASFRTDLTGQSDADGAAGGDSETESSSDRGSTDDEFYEQITRLQQRERVLRHRDAYYRDGANEEVKTQNA